MSNRGGRTPPQKAPAHLPVQYPHEPFPGGRGCLMRFGAAKPSHFQPRNYERIGTTPCVAGSLARPSVSSGTTRCMITW